MLTLDSLVGFAVEILLAVILFVLLLILGAIRIAAANSYDQTQNTRWESTDSHRQAILDMAGELEVLRERVDRYDEGKSGPIW